MQPQRRIGKILTSDRKGGPSEGYEIALYGKLQDKKWASGYLAECMKEDPDTFLVGLKHVVTANGGMAKISKMTHLNRESLYRALSEKGNPSLEYVRTILSVLGIELTVKQKA